MKESSSSLWPRGLPAGALLAAILIVPAFVVMMLDSSDEATRTSSRFPGKFAMFPHLIQLRASSAFFDGRLAVQAVLLQRFAPLPPVDPMKSKDERHDLVPTAPPPGMGHPELLRLRLENRSDQNIEVQIVRVDSDLGNLLAHPDRLLLAPHQTANVDSPVPGRKITAAALPVTVALRLAGNVETRNLVLHGHTLARSGD